MHLLAWQGWIIHPSILNRITCNPRPWYTQILFLKTTVNRTPLKVQRYQDLQKIPVSTLKCSYWFPWNNCTFLLLNNYNSQVAYKISYFATFDQLSQLPEVGAKQNITSSWSLFLQNDTPRITVRNPQETESH